MIRLLLELALVLELGRLPGRDRPRAERRMDDRQKEPEQRSVVDERGLLLLPDDVMRGDVHELVGEHAGELGFARHAEDEAGVHVDVAARNGERVQVLVAHDEETIRERLVLQACDQPAADLAEISRDGRRA